MFVCGAVWSVKDGTFVLSLRGPPREEGVEGGLGFVGGLVESRVRECYVVVAFVVVVFVEVVFVYVVVSKIRVAFRIAYFVAVFISVFFVIGSSIAFDVAIVVVAFDALLNAAIDTFFFIDLIRKHTSFVHSL